MHQAKAEKEKADLRRKASEREEARNAEQQSEVRRRV
jgi:hypothetical protein